MYFFYQILNACLAKEPKRTDIIKEYIDYYLREGYGSALKLAGNIP